MYAVSRAPSKFASKATRRGPAQIEKLDNNRETARREPFGPSAMSSPKPVFNGKKNNYSRSNNNRAMAQEPISHQHQDNVRFVADAWHRVLYEMDMARGTDGGPVWYQDKTPNNSDGFVPFDLEQWWGQRTLQHIHQST